MALGSITVQELAALRRQGRKLGLLDVRTPAEYAAGHVQGARLVPLQRLTTEAATEGRPAPDQPLYVICKSGGRSLLACRQLAAAGLHAVNVTGGTDAWIAAGLPVERDPAAATDRGGGAARRASLRLIAWVLLVAGLLLSGIAHPAWAGLALAGWATLVLTGGCCGSACALPQPPQTRANEG